MDLFWQLRDCFLAVCHHFDCLGDSGIVDAQAVFRIPMKFCVIGGGTTGFHMRKRYFMFFREIMAVIGRLLPQNSDCQPHRPDGSR
jgi:hypothetical protein